MNPYDRLLLPENLNYAWRKAKRIYAAVDGYVDLGEVADFELDLEDRLQKIRSRFRTGRYRLRPLRPLPRPKELRDDRPRDRQYFHVPIDDQVAWLAIVNALGPDLDQRMPPWSYGNRLYRAAWYDEDPDGNSRLEVGPYRHASGHLYRKFQHSWPLFRRHVALTAKSMAKGVPPVHDDLDAPDKFALSVAQRNSLPYLQPMFWRPGGKRDLHYASFDLKHFYPSIRSEAIMRGFHAAVPGLADSPLLVLLEKMLSFRLNKLGMKKGDFSNVQPQFGGREITGIPTGLFVSGFLANVAMLSVDQAAEMAIREKRSLAHFRFVDDHTVLSYEFDDLCDWLDQYQGLLRKHDIGADVNPEKYDPEALSDWMTLRGEKQPPPSGAADVRDSAVRNTRLDGANPTPLLTKTLEQVSAIAVTTPHVLDDEDLRERLELLEWLLLADIPDRELRADTRAAFAAGRIAAIAPLLVRETGRLVDVARTLAELERRVPVGRDTADTDEKEPSSQDRLDKVRIDYQKLVDAQADERKHHLRRCFLLLTRAFREHPSKARLFFRIHQYCRVTGYSGLSDVVKLIQELEEQERHQWADYYAGLSLQILTVGLPMAIRRLIGTNTPRSARRAARNHLADVTSIIDNTVLQVAPDRETWFHAQARRAFGVTLLASSRLVRQDEQQLSHDLRRLAFFYVPDVDNDQFSWVEETGYSAGVWAHMIESALNVNQPSESWRDFERHFSYARKSDRLASRRYPEVLSDRAWSQILQFPKTIGDDDCGWIHDAIRWHPDRIAGARASTRRVLLRAARTCDKTVNDRWITLFEWTEFVQSHCDEFDPRRGEWTALEIMRQIIEQATTHGGGATGFLKYLHPNNVSLPSSWCRWPEISDVGNTPSWEQWRTVVVEIMTKKGPPKFRGRVRDYRYHTYAVQPPDEWRRRLVSVGRVLVGLLRCDFEHPRAWNIRGNERLDFFSGGSLFGRLSISTPTLALLDGCLSGRAAETSAIRKWPQLFGWKEGKIVNDAEFDPPFLDQPEDLLNAIKSAQRVLVDNQLAIAQNRPRQLVPFRLRDFGTGTRETDEADVEDE